MRANNYGLADLVADAMDSMPRGAHPAAPAFVAARRRLLVLGWNRKVPVLLQELENYESERFEVDVVSNVPVAQRESVATLLDVRLERTRVQHLERDYTAVPHLRATAPCSHDSVLLVASEWHGSDEEADARSVLATLLLREEVAGADVRTPPIVVELMDAENVRLLGHAGVEHLVSPDIISHILAQVALRRELRAVYDELFGPGGAEISFRPAADYGVVNRQATFAEIARAAQAHGEIALGVRVAGQVQLNPSRETAWTFGDGDRLVVVTTYAPGASPPEAADGPAVQDTA